MTKGEIVGNIGIDVKDRGRSQMDSPI